MTTFEDRERERETERERKPTCACPAILVEGIPWIASTGEAANGVSADLFTSIHGQRTLVNILKRFKNTHTQKHTLNKMLKANPRFKWQQQGRQAKVCASQF